MFGLDEEFHLHQGSFTQQVLEASNHAHMNNNPSVFLSSDNASTTHFSSSSLCVPELSSMQTSPHQREVNNHIHQHDPTASSAFNSQKTLHPTNSPPHHSGSLHAPVKSPIPSQGSTIQNDPSASSSAPPASVPSLSAQGMNMIPQQYQFIQPYASNLPPASMHELYMAMQQTVLHHSQLSQQELGQQMAQQMAGQLQNGEQLNPFIMQQLYQQYIMYLQNEITCLRQSHGSPQLSPEQTHSLQPLQPLQPIPHQQHHQQQQQQQHHQQQQNGAIMSPPSNGVSPASTAPRSASPTPKEPPPLSLNNSGGLPPPNNTARSSASSSPKLVPYFSTITTKPSKTQQPNHHQTPPQKPMKFHLVQYSKQPTVEEFEARAHNGSPDSPDSPSQQSATINKLQINPELLTMKQSEAARILGISPSMLSKRWREAMNGRKWPYRVHRKLQKEINSIVTLMDDNGKTITISADSPKIEPCSPPTSTQDMTARLKLVSMYKSIETTSQ